MEYKNKYILPLNSKAKFIYIAGLIVIIFFIAISVDQIKQNNWVVAIICSLLTAFMIWAYIMFWCIGLRFKCDKLKLPKARDEMGKLLETEVAYDKIQSVEVVTKEETGVHLKGLVFKGIVATTGDVDTLVIKATQGKRYLLSLQYYSKKQIKYIIEEISRRANIKD